MIDSFVGRWKLLSNSDNFEEFLVHNGYGFLKRKAALLSNITVTLTKMDEMTLYKAVDSTFLNLEEYVKVDGKPHTNSESSVKRHYWESATTLCSEVSTTSDVSWIERAEVGNNVLTVTREWDDDKGSHTVFQTFVRD